MGGGGGRTVVLAAAGALISVVMAVAAPFPWRRQDFDLGGSRTIDLLGGGDLGPLTLVAAGTLAYEMITAA